MIPRTTRNSQNGYDSRMSAGINMMPVMPPPNVGQKAVYERDQELEEQLSAKSLSEQVEALLNVESTIDFSAGSPPERMIFCESDMNKWLQSVAYVRVMVFIQALNASVVDKANSSVVLESTSVNMKRLYAFLEVIDKWADHTELVPGESRFGNKGFAAFIETIENDGLQNLKSMLSDSEFGQSDGLSTELYGYIVVSFGHKVRLDYGSGHELGFIAFLCCLFIVKFITADELPALVLIIFNKYLEICRKVQIKFRLEPAGSHGVWGLDDHQFLPYYFGAAQLLGHARLKPRSILNPEIYENFAKEYMFMRCIEFIHETKRGPFHEHSPLLYDISGVPSWKKVNSGMLKMFNAEVMEKFPVVQHFLFGTLLSFKKCKIE